MAAGVKCGVEAVGTNTQANVSKHTCNLRSPEQRLRRGLAFSSTVGGTALVRPLQRWQRIALKQARLEPGEQRSQQRRLAAVGIQRLEVCGRAGAGASVEAQYGASGRGSSSENSTMPRPLATTPPPSRTREERGDAAQQELANVRVRGRRKCLALLRPRQRKVVTNGDEAVSGRG